MPERIAIFGEGVRLAGVLSQPPRQERRPDAPAILLWNAGLLHHVGTCRLYVDLSRRLAGLGFSSLRFDLSGLGDSSTRKTSIPMRERNIVDIKDAMDYLEAKEIARNFILVGLCTGADAAHFAAVADSRVMGLVNIDGYAYPTPRFYLHRLLSFATNGRRIAGFLKRRFQKASSSTPSDAVPDIAKDIFSWSFPPRTDAERHIREFLERGARLLYIYTGEMFAEYNYRDQFHDMFKLPDAGDRLQVRYLDHSDHLFSLPGKQELFLSTLCDWIKDFQIS